MTKRDLFKIILKLFGLYLVILIIVDIPNLWFYLYYDSSFEMSWLLLSVQITALFVTYLLIFKPNIFINLFKLDKGFDTNELPTKTFDGKGVTKIALVIIAVHLIVNNIGIFITQIIYAFKETASENAIVNMTESFSHDPFNKLDLIQSIICLVVGTFLLTHNTKISTWVEKMNIKNID